MIQWKAHELWTLMHSASPLIIAERPLCEIASPVILMHKDIILSNYELLCSW